MLSGVSEGGIETNQYPFANSQKHGVYDLQSDEWDSLTYPEHRKNLSTTIVGHSVCWISGTSGITASRKYLTAWHSAEKSCQGSSSARGVCRLPGPLMDRTFFNWSYLHQVLFSSSGRRCFNSTESSIGEMTVAGKVGS